MTKLLAHITLDNESFDVEYLSVDGILGDLGLRGVMDAGGTAVLRCGSLRLHGRECRSWEDLRDQVVRNSATILRALGR